MDFVLEEDGRIIGNIMYTRARLVDEAGREKEILTFGPVCVERAPSAVGMAKRSWSTPSPGAAELGL